MSIAIRNQKIKNWLDPIAYDELAGYSKSNLVGSLDLIISCLGHSTVITYQEIADEREDLVRPKLRALHNVAYSKEETPAPLHKRLAVWFVEVCGSRHFYPHESAALKDLMDEVKALEDKCR